MRIAKAVLATAALAAAAVYTRRSVRETERSHPPTGRFVTTGQGVRLHYERHGRGRPVILIHGAASQLQDMTSSLLPALADGYEVFAFDRPGHGYSSGLPCRPTVEAQARAIRAAARLLRLDKPVIVGHSIGGAVAMAYGALFADEVAGIVFLSGPAYPERPGGALKSAGLALPFVGDLLACTLYRAIQPKLAASTLRRFFLPQEVPPRLMRALPLAMLCRPQAIKADAEEQMLTAPSLIGLERHYDDYPLPVAVFAGTDDRTTDPEKHAIRLSRQLPRAELHLLPGLGHMVHHFAQEEIARAVDQMASSAPTDRQPLRA